MKFWTPITQEQYEWLTKAIDHWRALQTTLRQMQQLSRQVLFTTAPGPQRRKRLNKKIMGLT